MKLIHTTLAVAFLALPSTALANPIERACLTSGSSGANRTLCSCIGAVADQSLSNSQMREGARWFDDPHRAQEVRQSDRPRDEAMWTAWSVFGQLAEATCS